MPAAACFIPAFREAGKERGDRTEFLPRRDRASKPEKSRQVFTNRGWPCYDSGMGSPRPEQLRAFAGRDWNRVAGEKTAYWRHRSGGGLAAALRMMQELWDNACTLRSDWPSTKDREEVLETHRQVSAKLRRVAAKRGR